MCSVPPGVCGPGPGRRTGLSLRRSLQGSARRGPERRRSSGTGGVPGSGRHRGPRGRVFSKTWARLLSAQPPGCPRAWGLRSDATQGPGPGASFPATGPSLTWTWGRYALCGPGWLRVTGLPTLPRAPSEGSVHPGGGGGPIPRPPHGLCPGDESPPSSLVPRAASLSWSEEETPPAAACPRACCYSEQPRAQLGTEHSRVNRCPRAHR